MKNIVKSKIKEINQQNNKKILSLINSLSENVSSQSVEQDKKRLYDLLDNQSPHINKEVSNNVPNTNIIGNPYYVMTEINKINLNNTFRLLDVHNNILENYSKNVISQSLMLMERLQSNFSMKYIYFTVFSLFAYEYYTNFYKKSNPLDINKLISLYQNQCPDSFRYESKIPVFEDHSNLINLIDNNNKLFLIGESGIGKTLSLKNYLIILSQNKENIVLYFDLNKENYDSNESFENYILSRILGDLKINSLPQNSINEILESLRNLRVLIVLDNFSSHSEHFLKKATDFSEKVNGKIITIANINEHTELAINNNFYVKFIQNKQRDKMIEYIKDRFNLFLKSRLDYSNIESLDLDKINYLYQNFTDINFNHLINYIDNQQSFNDFISSENSKNMQKVNYVKRKHTHSFETLKLLAKSNPKGEWSKIPEKINREDLLVLEKFNIVSFRNSSEFKINNKNTLSLLN